MMDTRMSRKSCGWGGGWCISVSPHLCSVDGCGGVEYGHEVGLVHGGYADAVGAGVGLGRWLGRVWCTCL